MAQHHRNHKEQPLSKRSILTTTLKTLALTGSLAFFSVSLLQSCRGSVQEGFPAATNSPTAVPTVPDVLTEPPGKASATLKSRRSTPIMSTFNTVVSQFTTAATHYAAAIQPYALRLFLALLFIDVLVTCVQFLIDQGDAPHYVGRLIRHILSGGFIYLMILNAFRG
jgi:hypothetical protein